MTKTLPRTLLAAALCAVATSAAADGFFRPDTRDSVFGIGVATQPGITKHFEFAGVQTNASTLAAAGAVFESQDDTTGVYGNFALIGNVKCLRVAGNHAVLGLVITRGSGTAASHVGEAFYLFMNDNSAAHAPDQFDNSGYTGTTVPDCTQDGGTGQVVTRGNILVDDD